MKFAGSESTSVAFRVDGSTKIGTGHVMRCLTLANALCERGVATHFICRAHPGHMADQIRSEGHGVTLLSLNEDMPLDDIVEGSSSYASWLGASWMQDAEETKQYILNACPSWLIVDHYAIDSGWESIVKGATGVKIMAIDGLANRTHNCDLLLDQTYSPEGSERWKRLVPADCQLFVGPQYALLRPEFIEARRTLRQRDGVVRRIFIAFGGVDEPNATNAALAAVVELNRPDITIDVVVGVANPHRNEQQARCQELENATLHVQPSNMAELMTLADLAISGGGTMLWEQCYLNLPTLIISIAENQIKPAEALQKIGGAVYIGDVGVTTQNSIIQNIKMLINDQFKLKQIQFTLKSLMTEPDLPIIQFLLRTI